MDDRLSRKPCMAGHTACGCSVGGPCCLRCRLPVCRYDDEKGAGRGYHEEKERNRSEAKRLAQEGMWRPDIAAALGLSERTVSRYLSA